MPRVSQKKTRLTSPLDIADFIGMSPSWVKQNKKKNEITEKAFLRIAEACGYEDHRDLLAILGVSQERESTPCSPSPPALDRRKGFESFPTHPRGASLRGSNVVGAQGSSVMLTVPLPGLIGRDNERDAICAPVEFGARKLIIEGISGVGKSSLAKECIGELVRQNTYSRVIEISARETNLSLSSVLDEILVALRFPTYTQLSVSDRASRCADLLSAENTAILVDNFEDTKGSDRREILAFLGKLPKADTIITTRSYPGLTVEAGETFRFIHLNGLDFSDCNALLQSEANRLALNIDLSELSEEVEILHSITKGNPLALKFLVSQMRFSPYSLGDMIHEITSGEAEIFDFLFERSWKSLGEPEVDILMASGTFFPAPFGRDAIDAISDTKRKDTSLHLAVLIGHSFVERATPLYERHQRFTTHPLVAAFSEAKFTDREARERIAGRLYDHYLKILAHDDVTFWEGRASYDQLDADRPNIVFLSDWLIENDKRNEFAHLTKAMADLLYTRGFWGACIKYGKQAAIAASATNQDSLEAWIRIHMLGHLYTNRYDFSPALRELERAVELARAADDAPLLSVALRNLGRCFRKQNEAQRARSQYEESIKIAERLGLRRELALAVNELGKLERDSENERQALAEFERALGVLREGDSAIPAGIQCNIAGVAIDLEKLDLAESAAKKAFEFFEGVENMEGIASAKLRMARIAKLRCAPNASSLAAEARTYFQKLGMDRDVSAINAEFFEDDEAWG
ncbi:tetratricopeptide repeat protein [Rhodovulum sulfidophilum]|uniref:tetratricopeptide repeat protein n=1 Tax=Rhodovulum sulfidophilum TaxID=35806 RepID=UPI0019221376|nr:tetratricopeptide repeat protein [Rhodovulum sulfidophilum]